MRRYIQTIVIGALVLIGGVVLYAAPPTSQYRPAETLDPTCSPGDANCSVSPLNLGQAIGANASGTSPTSGGLFFADSSDLFSQDSALFWDESNNRLGIASSTPSQALTVTGQVLATSDVCLTSGVCLSTASTSSSPWTTSGSDIYYTTGNVGIGVTSPSDELQVGGTNPEITIGDGGAENATLAFDGAGTDFYFGYKNSFGGLELGTGNAFDSGKLYIGSGGGIGIGEVGGAPFLVGGSGTITAEIHSSNSQARINFDSDASGGGDWLVGTGHGGLMGQDALYFYAGGDERAELDTNGDFYVGNNLGVGGASFGTNAAKVLAIANGTAPSTSITNGVQLYSEDTAASAELKVRDEAGNVTTLSPHNFSLVGQPSHDMAWSYYSEKDGMAINVDMFRVVQLLEEMSGEKLIHIEKIAK